MRVMALDWGTRRIGIAVSDELGIAAHGLPTLERKNIRRDLDALASVIRDRGIETVVVGLPLHMDGSESKSSNQANRFARRLAKHTGVIVEMRDERLTSWAADVSSDRPSRVRGARDRASATILLEDYLAEIRA